MCSEQLAVWAETSLGECATWFSGGTPDTSVPEYWGGEIPWITASSLHEFYLQDSERRITKLGLENGSRLVPEGAIIFVVRGMSLKAEFRVGIAMRPMAFGQDCKAIVGKDWIDSRFLANALRAKASDVMTLVDEASHGTGRLQTSALEQLAIPVPPLPEQRAIARIASVLDDKIKLIREMNETLEATAQALFTSWFVDFDPVMSKSKGVVPRRLPRNISELFPNRFSASESVQIPEGWSIASLTDIADFRNGLALQNYPSDSNEYLPVVKIRELRQGSADQSSDKASLAIPSDYVIDDGDVVFSWSGSLLVDMWCGGRGALNQHLFKVTSSSYPKWFYYFWIRYHLAEFVRIAADKATTMGHIKRHHLSDARVAIPPRALFELTSPVFQPLLEQIVVNRQASRTLVELRDSLLPKLISGELRVTDVERLVEDVT